MKKILVFSAVLIGAVSASQAGVLQDIGFNIRLPFLPRVVVRPPAPVCQAPPVYEAPRRVYVAPPPVCPPPQVVYAPAPVVCAPAPVYHWDDRGRRHGSPDRDFRHD